MNAVERKYGDPVILFKAIIAHNRQLNRKLNAFKARQAALRRRTAATCPLNPDAEVGI